jgi:hypothetical protein
VTSLSAFCILASSKKFSCRKVAAHFLLLNSGGRITHVAQMARIVIEYWVAESPRWHKWHPSTDGGLRFTGGIQARPQCSMRAVCRHSRFCWPLSCQYASKWLIYVGNVRAIRGTGITSPSVLCIGASSKKLPVFATKTGSTFSHQITGG